MKAPKRGEATYFARAGGVGRSDLRARTPELAPLESCVVSVFGLGCIGAPSAIEFAKAGVGELRILDPDFVEPGTLCRWPFGLSAAGRLKIDVLSEHIEANYPYVKVQSSDLRIGAPWGANSAEHGDTNQLLKLTAGSSLIYDATAEPGVQHFLSDFAFDHLLPYIAVDGTFGGWGGRLCRIIPGQTDGCWMCFLASLKDGTIPSPPAKEGKGLQPAGCGDVTFTGASFDLTEMSLAGVRLAISTLCGESEGGYPKSPWDVMVVNLRNANGDLIPPAFQTHTLKRHPDCPRCHPSVDAARKAGFRSAS